MADVKKINGYNIKDATARTGVSNLETALSNKFVIQEFQGTMTIVGNGFYRTSHNIAKSGYTPIAFAEITSQFPSYGAIGEFQIVSNTAYITYVNKNADAVTNESYRFKILYMKS